jgi:DNA-binding protein HU-beta
MIGKQVFISEISKKLKLENQEVKVENVVNSFLECLEDFLVNGERITFQGLFSLELVKRSARNGRNPRTGLQFMIPEKKAVSFKTGSNLKEKINRI